MNLRTRFALGTAVLVAGAIAATGWLLVDDAEDELIGEVDAFLTDRADQLTSVPELVDPGSSRRGGFGRGPFVGGRFSQDDAIAQLIVTDGTVVPLTDVELPVSDEDLEVTRSGEPSLRTVDIEGVDHRVLTVPVNRLGIAVMIGRDLSEVSGAIDDLTRRAVWTGLVGAALAALAGWIVGGRLSQPVRELTRTAEHVATTQELTASIGADRGNDEVGRLARSFDTMLSALDTSRRQQQRLVVDASHELRTPLTSMRTNVDLLRRARSIDDEERREILDDVSRELDELGALVGELVELSTASRRPDEPVVPVDLAAVAADVADRARRRYDRPVDVRTDEAATIAGRRSLLDRALWNLVDNAAKFSPEPSAIEVRVAGGTVEVRDHGPGIAATDRDHVFSRFYRAVETRSAPGSGLGLSIVADIVGSHGGHCFVRDPDEGGGVVVGFELPIDTVEDQRR